MSNALYLPSTPLNLLISLAVAISRQATDTAELWFIDQRQDCDHNPYFQTLSGWENTPFQQVQLFTGMKKGLAKLTERQQQFARIKAGLTRFQPEIIAVGSDRRIEFQYAMHLMSTNARSTNARSTHTESTHHASVEGWYLDDGLYSYQGRPQRPIQDRMNAYLKKLSYGRWWDEPTTIGASHWIHHAWLLQPEKAVAALKQKILHPLTPEMLTSDALCQFSQLMVQQFHLNASQLAQVDYIIMISHPNNQKKIPHYTEQLTQIMTHLLVNHKKIALKYHPRQVGDDPLRLALDASVLLLPSMLAFEFILPLLKPEATVSGEMSSILMTAQWLRPEISVLTQQQLFTEINSATKSLSELTTQTA